jgi:hypothetical protein
MKNPVLLFTSLVCASALAQVHVDKPLVLTSTDSTLRAIEGLAPATNETGLINLADAQSGGYHWGQASGTAMAIQLALNPPCTGYTSGLTVRFLPAASSYGAVTLNVDGLGAKRVYRSDARPVSVGQHQPGTIAEAVYADTAFYLMGREQAGCPAGYLSGGGDLCMMRDDTLNVSIYSATKWCFDRGARLCSWDEYIAACTANQSELIGLYGQWERIDGTSDHTHTANQAGLWNCRMQRQVGAVESDNNYGQVRCCLRIRR